MSATVGNPYKHRTTSGSVQIRAQWTVSLSCLGQASIGWWVDGKQYKAGDGYYRLGRATYSYVVGGCKTGDYQQHLHVLYVSNSSGDGTEIRRASSKVHISC
ncbi:hypothetical protein [Nonomuraea sp. 10N515B]|uniref:hypothetical protein n=1 Tax=Nonomuraea sp. 10N515B TaxID=3457422 RepID=UPI003FCDE298